MKLINEIKDKERILIIFNHGLGDFINFIPVFEELKRQTDKNITICSEVKREFHLIYPDIIPNDKVDLSKYDYIKRINYKEFHDITKPLEWGSKLSKVYHCAYEEIGLKEFIWKPYQFKEELNNKDSKRIGVSFFGLTGSEKNSKFCPKDIAEKIWNEIIYCDYEPFELYQRVNFVGDYYRSGNVPDDFDLVNETNSLRFQEPNLKLLYNSIKNCKKVISVDTGILYLAVSVLGLDNVMGLENMKYISNFLPAPIQLTSVRYYKERNIIEFLKGE
jgi:hypothetical protein